MGCGSFARHAYNIIMTSNPPPSPPSPPNPNPIKDYFASPALSLSLAGIFRHGTSSGGNTEVEEGEEGSGGGGGSKDTVEISSENSGAARSAAASDDDSDGGGEDNKVNKKKRKKYHRHTADQIRQMEALFKESPHPDEKQRQELGKQLGLHPRQVKFWFQNRRTQIKAIQERHENSLLKTEMDKLRDENKALRDTISNSTCPDCGVSTSAKDVSTATPEEQQLRIENARLKSEIEKLRGAVGNYPSGTSPTSPSCSTGYNDDQAENKCCIDVHKGSFGLEKSRITGICNVATEEVIKMATAGEPLWIRSIETGREILNYDEYMKYFSAEEPKGSSIEASRETGLVFMDSPTLVQSLMDVNQWQELFPCLISKATTVEVIHGGGGEGADKNGAIQLIFAELQMLTPLVATRQVYFVRYCKQLNADTWAVVDVSVDKVEHNIDAPLIKCRKRPSGCIIEDKSNGHCKVICVEHLECQKSTEHTLYRTLVNSGLAFGARRWMKTLQLQSERLVFFMATNLPTKDSSGVATLAGRKSILTLAQRMTKNFCRALGASSCHTWNKAPSKTGHDIRIASRKNSNEPGEPLGIILCAVSSVWLSVSHHILFDFLRDESRRNEWDIMSNGGPLQTIVNLAKGQDRGNAVTIQEMKPNENSMWILQDSCTNEYESTVVYAPVDITGMRSVITGCDSSDVAILPSGFWIVPEGLESRALVLTSRQEDKNTDGGSLLTIAFQILVSNSTTGKLSAEAVDSVTNLISCTLHNIKTGLQCENG